MAITVSDLCESIKLLFTCNFKKDIKVKGELANVNLKNSRLYASVKDAYTSLDIIMWTCNTEIKNGDNVTLTGRLEFYLKSGRINMIVHKIEKEGIGDLLKEYEMRKEKYKNMGYFENKKEPPKKIRNIGIVTSQTGAAIKDIMYVLENRKFNGKVYLKDCLVQGETCGKSISKAIDEMQKYKNDIDALLITRGGGSFDDLIGFSEPVVLESIKKSKIFTISAVGHEIDNMLSDFVADIRQPTPSIGAEYICNLNCCDRDEVEKMDNRLNDIKNIIEYNIESKIRMLKTLKDKLKDPNEYITDTIKNLDDKEKDVFTFIQNEVLKKKNHMFNMKKIIEKYDDKKIFKNGFNMILDNDDPITTIEELKKYDGKKLKILMYDGEVKVKLNING
uniref:Exonuclease VII large subunit C-terminal domain-containing protein n=1 Tax=viral metagenome TaxID=1070528 RepID=A0A6C0EB25_9ZZZZ